MSRALARRVAFVIGICAILSLAIGGTITQRRSVADYALASSAVRERIGRYEALLINGEPRTRAVSALQAAGAEVESTSGDIVVTVLHELAASQQCRSLVGQLHVAIDAHDCVDGWESPPLNAECD